MISPKTPCQVHDTPHTVRRKQSNSGVETGPLEERWPYNTYVGEVTSKKSRLITCFHRIFHPRRPRGSSSGQNEVKRAKIKWVINQCELLGINFLKFLFGLKNIESTGLYV